MEEEIREPCRALSQGETLAFEEEHSGGREAKEEVGTGWCGGRMVAQMREKSSWARREQVEKVGLLFSQ